jgi:hypothetical protein
VRPFATFAGVALATGAVIGATATTTGTAPPGRSAGAGAAPAPRVVRVRAGRLLARRPYLGVSCRVANSIRCDRVGLAVWLRRPAGAVRAQIARRWFRLEDVSSAPEPMYTGFLRRAGLADGPLQVPFTARGRWFGEGRVDTRVRIRVRSRGRTRTTVVAVRLQPGWG